MSNIITIKITIFYFNIFKNGIYSCDGNAEFSVAWILFPFWSSTAMQVMQITVDK